MEEDSVNIVDKKKPIIKAQMGLDLIKISEILTKETYVIGNNVRNESGRNYGKVYSIDFDTKSFYLRQIYVQQTILGIINYDRRIFSFDTIIEIKPDFIIVDDKTEKKEEVINTAAEDKPANAMG